MSHRQPNTVSRTQEFRVQLTTWELYEIWVKAADAETARKDAEHMWHELGPEAFRFRDNGLDDVTVIGTQEADA
tara:strand:+ start:180 stop:401 length:222 start_codon:yes stop_codon:yes gene_type:complete